MPWVITATKKDLMEGHVVVRGVLIAWSVLCFLLLSFLVTANQAKGFLPMGNAMEDAFWVDGLSLIASQVLLYVAYWRRSFEFVFPSNPLWARPASPLPRQSEGFNKNLDHVAVIVITALLLQFCCLDLMAILMRYMHVRNSACALQPVICLTPLSFFTQDTAVFEGVVYITASYGLAWFIFAVFYALWVEMLDRPHTA